MNKLNDEDKHQLSVFNGAILNFVYALLQQNKGHINDAVYDHIYKTYDFSKMEVKQENKDDKA